MSHRDEHLDMCAAYAVGSLDDAERAEFLAHLDSGCTECAAMLRELERTAALLGSGVQPVEPPPRLRAAVLAAIEPDAPGADAPPPPIPLPRRPRRTGWIGWVAATAAAIVAIVGLQESGRLREEVTRLEEMVAELRANLSASRR